MDKQYYTAFSIQREELRQEWNKTDGIDWDEFLNTAELRAQKVKDATNVSLSTLRKKQIEEIYNDLYNKVELDKKFNIKYNVGKAKYVINYHNGIKTHKDGSKFYDIQIYKNKLIFNRAIKELLSEGYKQEI